MTYVLWIVQGLLALLFLFTGGIKLVLPLEVLTEGSPLPGWFVRFLGVAEVLGAIGLILPGLLRIRPGLTPLAACGLVIIMIGADALTAQTIREAAPAASGRRRRTPRGAPPPAGSAPARHHRPAQHLPARAP